ncbi:uncharacterized protein N0V89_004474 [Didymosphaeria variabile]|uniref:HCP-like protein n=1 Tax=Didymosphaeria variabile TaxID=1932322 RepID=A0A9W9CDL8_9PLEO|nr:uncharacterized protein N0V89_004474 [Didymosphaeria variabile]KAJ4356441.1 hypothetical protein N0V89_004474 [Didymosphaeria variabile]
MLHADKLLPCKLEDANKIINEFVNNQAKNMDPATNVRKLAELAASMLLACSAAGDLQATLQILNAVYYSSNAYNMPKAVDIARLFTPKDISDCRRMLEQLAEGNDGKPEAKGDANAMTLHGKLLELAGKHQEAKYFYEKALKRYNTKIYRGYPHPMALPWLTPWLEFANLEKASEAPRYVKIFQALEFGALKADDPMAYYKLASMQTDEKAEWLEYMTKAAASGHSEAMYKLGRFYLKANEHASAFLNSAKLRKVLKFVVSWRPNATADFGMEWLRAAALGGHKPALMEMAQLHEKKGEQEQARDCLRAVASEPLGGIPEEWPHLVLQARKQLDAL